MDCTTPAGKRNYAILLLAIRTGLRSIDIINLKLGDIQWRRNTIEIVQAKTGAPLILPLLTDVGNALADYVLNGRPNSQQPYLFLRTQAPYRQLSVRAGYGLSCKMMKAAHIRQSLGDRKGLHCLRHYVAARLLSEETPLPIISSILGHRNKDSTKVYLSTDLAHLRACALGLNWDRSHPGGIAMNTPISGNFKLYIEGLIEEKRSIGYPYDSSARILKVFSIFCLDHYPDETVLTQKMAMHWAEKRPDEHVNGLIRRITPIRQLAKYMNRLGIEAYLIPEGIPGKLVRFTPHIFTEPELQTFFSEIDRCARSPSSPARHLVIPVFFRLLYCCGLRSSEARLLNVEDVDLENGKLMIRHAKGNKDRNVMMSEEISPSMPDL